MNKVLFIWGIAILAAVWVGPLPAWAEGSFTAHMTMHMGVVAVAAPLIAGGVSGSRLDPVTRFPRLLAPIPASILELIVVWSWHAPALHHFARQTRTGLVLEQGMFLACGLLVWLSSVGGVRGGERAGAGIAALLLTSMHMTLLGALLALAPRTLYAHTVGFAGFTPLEDQHLGGAVMLLVGGMAYLSGGLWLGAGILRSKRGRSAEASPS